MSFLGGPECSTASNPLSQFQKHTQADNGLQRDRLINSAPGAAQGGFRSTSAPGSHDQAMNGFLNGPVLQPNSPHHLIASLPPEAVMRAGAPPAAANWAQDFHASQMAASAVFQPHSTASFNPDEFAKFQMPAQHGGTAGSSHMQMQRPMAGIGMGTGMSMGMGMGMGYSAMGQPFQHHQFQQHAQPQHHQQPQSVDKGKCKEVLGLDDRGWEQQFAEIDQQQQASADAGGEQLDQPDKTKQSETYDGDFEAIWKGIQAEAEANKEFDAAALDNFPEFSDVGRFNDAWFEPYTFEPDNMFSGRKNAFDEGVRIMNEGGNLSLAALAFEAAVQQNPNHVDAWVQLGNAQAQNEKETAAIRAHEQALQLDPGNLVALMGLAVSYTNEGYESKAYRSLERWLSSKYPQIVPPPPTAQQAAAAAVDLGFSNQAELHKRVTESFIRAAQLSPDGNHMDPDVQVGLGVLFYGIEQYDKAIDCFQSALSSSEIGTVNQRGQVHLLWNRLGATLANSGRPEEAVLAYQRALTMNPNFVRARYNLAVSCININCYEEAASHLLAGLELHNAIAKSARNRAYEILSGSNDSGSAAAVPGAGNPAIDAQLDRVIAMNMSTTMYDTLRRVFSLMGREDLVNLTVAGVDPEVFRGVHDF